MVSNSSVLSVHAIDFVVRPSAARGEKAVRKVRALPSCRDQRDPGCRRVSRAHSLYTVYRRSENQEERDEHRHSWTGELGADRDLLRGPWLGQARRARPWVAV